LGSFKNYVPNCRPIPLSPFGTKGGRKYRVRVSEL
jgi:hypothetical protein